MRRIWINEQVNVFIAFAIIYMQMIAKNTHGFGFEQGANVDKKEYKGLFTLIGSALLGFLMVYQHKHPYYFEPFRSYIIEYGLTYVAVASFLILIKVSIAVSDLQAKIAEIESEIWAIKEGVANLQPQDTPDYYP